MCVMYSMYMYVCSYVCIQYMYIYVCLCVCLYWMCVNLYYCIFMHILNRKHSEVLCNETSDFALHVTHSNPDKIDKINLVAKVTKLC